MKPQLLLQRLNDIGRSLDESGHALALIGLGSVGVEQNRLDAFSDLDFFAIVEPGYKPNYLANLDWLSAISPIAYHFPNTEDGYKLLYADGIFCEFAVFEPDELQAASFASGRVVWKRPEVASTIGQSAKKSDNRPQRDQAWLLGEALTNLYVGMGRERRGERLSAMRFIQGYAVDRLLELVEQIEEAQPVTPDVFALERRFEQRYVDAARHAPLWLQGYEQNQASTLAILTFLEQHFPVNEAMAAAIRELCV